MPRNLKAFRESLNMTQKDFAASLGIGLTTYNGYEIGARDPKSDFWVAVAKQYGVTIDYLMGFSNDPLSTSADIKKSPSLTDEDLKIARDYQKLDSWGQKTIRVVLDAELARVNEGQGKVIELPKRRPVPLFGNSFAAGWGEPDFGKFWEEYEVPADSPAEFAIRITGNSMEPEIPDGSIALCRKTAPENGDVGAFLIDGEFVCKQVCVDYAGALHLFSLNRDRKDMDRHYQRDEIERQVICFGTVIMKKRLPLPLD